MNRDTGVSVILISCLALGGLGAVAGGCVDDVDRLHTKVGGSGGGFPVTDNDGGVDPTPEGDIAGFPSAQKCEACHAEIYKEWTTSMHSHAATSPVTVAQVNQVLGQEFKFEDDPDPQQFCNNCHGPIPTLITKQAGLPFEDARFSPAALNEGITCSTCHKYDVNEVPIIGYASDSEFQNNFNAGPFMFGPFADPLKSSFHESARSDLLADDDDSDRLCGSCHQVGIDLNKDGQLVVGEDFVLQNTFAEYLDYDSKGGAETCVSCHMPVRTGQAASVPGAPARQIRSHIFLGVDYPLDEVADGVDDLRPARERILSSAGQIDIENVDFAGGVLRSFDVTIENTGTGHNLPSGFAFMRQMWVEARVVDPTGARDFFTSGVLEDESNDLCDLNTLNDPSILTTEVIGCDSAEQEDDFLVNFQTKLVDKVEIVGGQVVATAGAREHWLQLLDGGAVTRVRPIDGKALAPLKPFEKRTFTYAVGATNVVRGSKIKVRLLFRNLPPYMVRKLGKDQPRDEVQLGPLIQHLQVTEMDSRETTLQ
jgi:nitrate/TMAO reductase-like tetraheme cytochrome c subunit